MKLTFKILLILMTTMFIVSCSCQKIHIVGKPRTEIYYKNMNKIGEIPKEGTLLIKLNKNNVYDMLLSHDKDSSSYVPFALNFTKRRGYELGYAVGIMTFAPTLYATFPLIVAQSEQAEYHYKYLPEQTTNQDIVFTPLKQTADYKTLDKKTERRKFSSGNSQSSKDPISIITGTYSGKGELLDGNDVIEKYSDIKVVIKKKDKNTVIIEILASDGYSYFDEEILYSVTKQDNQFVLKQKGANSRIIIKNGNLSYTNHNINDDDMIYTLKITAEK